MPLAPCLPLQDLSWTCSTHVQAWAPGAKAPSHPPAGEGVRRRANRERPLVCTQGSKFITSQLAPIARPEESRPGLAEDRRKEDQGEARQTHQRERATDEQPQGEVPVRCAGGEGGVLPSSRREKSRCGAPEGREACCPGPSGGAYGAAGGVARRMYNGGTRGGEQGPRPPLKSVKFFNPHLYSKAQHKGQSMQRCFVLKFFGYRP